MWNSSGFNTGSTTFFEFINDVQHVAIFLDPIMPVDDSNLFYSNSNIKKLFVSINKEQVNFIDWIYKKRVNPKKVTELKFLGVMIEESLNRKTHVKLAERKISKNYCSLF